MNTHVIASDTHRGISDLRRDISHIRRDVSEIKGWNGDKVHSVGTTLLIAQHNTYIHIRSGENLVGDPT